MIKRKFGMACLSISQGRFNDFSHKYLNAYDLNGMDTGVDRFKTFNDLEVVGIQDYKTTGFANTVLFYDQENDVTLAMTHCNSIPSGCYVGNVFHAGDTIYYEGKQPAKGATPPTGNHIHLEIGRGKQEEKEKINGIWQLRSLINIEDYFYIDSSYTTVRDDGGYVFSFDNEGSEVKMELKEGSNDITFNGKEYRIIKQPKNTDVMIWSFTHPNLYKLTAMNTDNVKPLFAKNLSFFQMGGTNNGYIYGSEISDIYDEAVPTSQKLIDVVKLKDGTWKFGNFGPYQYRKDECILRYSTGMVLVAGGVYSEEYSEGIANAALQEPVEMSATFVDWNNDAYMVASMSKVTHAEMRNLAMELNMQYAFRDDSGDSTCICENGVAINNYGGRALPNALVFIPKNENEDPDPIPDPGVPDEEYEALKKEYEELQVENGTLKKQIDEMAAKIETLTAVNDDLELKVDQAIQILEGEE